MHPSLHTLAHRAPAVSRAKARWQPYTSLDSSFSTSSPSSCLQTPKSVLPSPPISTPTQCQDDRVRLLSSLPPKDPPQKHKFALNLVDQAVKTLTDMWRPQDIPEVFLLANQSLPYEMLSTPAHVAQTSNRGRNTQLPSPISPCTRSTSPEVNLDSPAPALAVTPIKGFVHEVLRRSRTSGGVLQTALCYLQAVHPQINELCRLEKEGLGVRGEVALESRIIQATEAEIQSEYLSSPCSSEDGIDTVKVSDDDHIEPPAACEIPDDTLKKARGPSPPLPPLPCLPSPLLCPRRAFLASLILASKFAQDKCYSNRAWAKLSGLPPREISRCERALGDALGWRLWVGKASVTSKLSDAAAPPLVTPGRPLSRCRSENNIGATPSSTFLSNGENRTTMGSCLRRCSTLPAEVFASRLDTPSRVRNDPSEYVQQFASSIPILPGTSEISTVSMDSLAKDLDDGSSPDTPSLTLSPSSSVSSSSSGDRTIQMATFLDDNMAGPAGSTHGSESASWALGGSPPLMTPFSSCQAFTSQTWTAGVLDVVQKGGVHPLELANVKPYGTETVGIAGDVLACDPVGNPFQGLLESSVQWISSENYRALA